MFGSLAFASDGIDACAGVDEVVGKAGEELTLSSKFSSTLVGDDGPVARYTVIVAVVVGFVTAGDAMHVPQRTGHALEINSNRSALAQSANENAEHVLPSGNPLHSPAFCTTPPWMVALVALAATIKRGLCSAHARSRHSPGHFPINNKNVNGILHSACVYIKQVEWSGLPLHTAGIVVVVAFVTIVVDETVVVVGVGVVVDTVDASDVVVDVVVLAVVLVWVTDDVLVTVKVVTLVVVAVVVVDVSVGVVPVVDVPVDVPDDVADVELLVDDVVSNVVVDVAPQTWNSPA